MNTLYFESLGTGKYFVVPNANLIQQTDNSKNISRTYYKDFRTGNDFELSDVSARQPNTAVLQVPVEFDDIIDEYYQSGCRFIPMVRKCDELEYFIGAKITSRILNVLVECIDGQSLSVATYSLVYDKSVKLPLERKTEFIYDNDYESTPLGMLRCECDGCCEDAIFVRYGTTFLGSEVSPVDYSTNQGYSWEDVGVDSDVFVGIDVVEAKCNGRSAGFLTGGGDNRIYLTHDITCDNFTIVDDIDDDIIDFWIGDNGMVYIIAYGGESDEFVDSFKYNIYRTTISTGVVEYVHTIESPFELLGRPLVSIRSAGPNVIAYAHRNYAYSNNAGAELSWETGELPEAPISMSIIQSDAYKRKDAILKYYTGAGNYYHAHVCPECCSECETLVNFSLVRNLCNYFGADNSEGIDVRQDVYGRVTYITGRTSDGRVYVLIDQGFCFSIEEVVLPLSASIGNVDIYVDGNTQYVGVIR